MPRPLGQHFLRDLSVLHKIVAALELDGEEHVLEIGPGQGVLTRALAAVAGNVTAVELDSRLAADLRSQFSSQPSIRIVEADALDVDPCDLMPKTYKLAGNIPYYITGALLRKYLTTGCKPGRAVLMIQLEVARRILAGPGDMSLLSVSAQLFSTGSMVARVPPGAFNPPPKVDSAVIKLEVLPEPRVAIPSEEAFFRVARAGFGTRRKQLANALAIGLGLPKVATLQILNVAEIAPTRRAEELSLDEWGRLAFSADSELSGGAIR